MPPRPELFTQMVMLVPIRVSRALQLAHRSLRLTPAQQFWTRSNARTLTICEVLSDYRSGSEQNMAYAYQLPSGRKDGSDTWFNSDGACSSYMYWRNGEPHGDYVTYFNGQIHTRGTNLNGHLHGVFTITNWNGERMSDIFVAGVHHGTSIWYDSDGSMLRLENYRNDNKHGICVKWLSSGKIFVWKKYHNGTTV